MANIINIDLLQLSFDTSSFDETIISNFIIHQVKPSNGFSKSFIIYKYDYFNKIFVGYINIGLIKYPSYSFIHFDNKFLYRNDRQVILDDFISSFNLADLRIRKLDISINTNDNLLLSYHKNFGTIKSSLSDDYVMDSYQRDNTDIINGYNDILENKLSKKAIRDLIKTDINTKTKYIHSVKESFDNLSSKENDGKQPHKRFIRIENKSNEILISKKLYILEYYKNLNVLNINKPIYRMELGLTFENSLKKITTKWINNTDVSDVITDLKYNKLPYKSMSNYTKCNIDNSIIIDLSKLSDPIYLYSLFDYFAVADVSSLVDIDKILLKNSDNSRIFKRCTQSAIIKPAAPIYKNADNTAEIIMNDENHQRLINFYRNQLDLLTTDTEESYLFHEDYKVDYDYKNSPLNAFRNNLESKKSK